MYSIKHNQVSNILEIKDSKKYLAGKIYLNDGGSLQELTLGGKKIISDLSPLTYDITYASSILFPFANRIKDGLYNFNGKTYQLETNQEEEQNALHGFVFNKSFKIIKQNISDTCVEIVLEYIENKKSKGFPFTYNIQVSYIFSKNNLCLSVSVENTDTKVFPFTLGWHPYFLSENLYESSLRFDSKQKLKIGKRNITTGIKDFCLADKFQIKNQQLDDCWILDSDNIYFYTPSYKVSINSSVKNNFLQAYTPPKKNYIAIEPTTGVSDSFNNKIGLQTLSPNESYDITWSLKIVNN
ncbi:aldose 1-epimerase [Algibacter marinivivus]|uniref:Aldose 1-epimerase n=1 Tax=Algibacter marinivivus TaxID=2100723 RepID=A0A2U2X2F7_9FLAO|nr:aldose 1-epimerase [Algibacter marinivivus]PWH81962.1 aldose 1-epimerase [Algibacter marinivivus]